MFCVLSVARQVDGEMVVIKAEKAFSKASLADEYAKKMARNYTEVIQTATGPMNCVCERGVFEMEIED